MPDTQAAVVTLVVPQISVKMRATMYQPPVDHDYERIEMSEPIEINANPRISPLNDRTAIAPSGNRVTFTSEKGINNFKIEQNPPPYNSVGVRYNRFLASNEISFETSAYNPQKSVEVLQRFHTALDFSELTSRELQIFPTMPVTEKVPTIPDMSEGKILAHGFLDKVLDLTEIEAKDQEFLVNLIQRNFMQFNADGTEGIQSDINEVDSLTKKISVSQASSNQSKGSDFLQSFFLFDYSDKLQSGDFVRSAYLNLTISAHFGERTITSNAFHGCSSLLGDLRINPRKFEAVRVKKAFPVSYMNGTLADSRFLYDGTNQWSSYFGTGPDDVDRATNSVFTISEPMKRGQTLRINITNLLQDAVDNHGSVLRFALRPVQSYYHRYIVPNETANGVGNHWFEFERDTENRPHVTLDITPSKDSTGERLARLRRGEF